MSVRIFDFTINIPCHVYYWWFYNDAFSTEKGGFRLSTNQLPIVSFAYILFTDSSFTQKIFCLQFNCLQALFCTIKNFKNEGTFAHMTLLRISRIEHMILLPTNRLPTCCFAHN